MVIEEHDSFHVEGDAYAWFRARDTPVVWHNMTSNWTASTWSTSSTIADVFGDNLRGAARFCCREREASYAKRGHIIKEIECQHVNTNVADFIQWMNASSSSSSPSSSSPKVKRKRCCINDSNDVDEDYMLSLPPRDDYWGYFDYKHLSELTDGRYAVDAVNISDAIDWSVVGLQRDGSNSTLWIGTEDAHTQCHYDTYGFNLVAQLEGEKLWTLFPPSSTPSLYPTRMPFDESSVFSDVCIRSPNRILHPRFSALKPKAIKVILRPGDILFVPRHWWHDVRSLSTSISVNCWVDVPEDREARLAEAITIAAIKAFSTTPDGDGIVAFHDVDLQSQSLAEHIQIVQAAILDCKTEGSHRIGSNTFTRSTLKTLIHHFTQPQVISAIVTSILEENTNEEDS